MTNGTLRWELHDVLANDDHTVALHITRAERKGRSLADRVVYVFHVRDGQIREAWFSGDPRVQADFYG
jgi:ketosteroid isomerase-like protein